MLLAQYCYYLLLQRADVSRVFPFLFSAAPVVTMLIGVFGLKETLSAKQIVGATLVVIGGLFLL
ncbi:EamA-like transporter family protein [compost metagenome]